MSKIISPHRTGHVWSTTLRYLAPCPSLELHQRLLLHVRNWANPSLMTPPHSGDCVTPLSHRYDSLVWAPENPGIANTGFISTSVFPTKKEINKVDSLSMAWNWCYVSFCQQGGCSMKMVFWRRRGGVWQSVAEPTTSWTIMYYHHPLGEPLAKYDSTNMTNHLKTGYLQGSPSLAGTVGKTHWPVRWLANSPSILSSDYRTGADWGMNSWLED